MTILARPLAPAVAATVVAAALTVPSPAPGDSSARPPYRVAATMQPSTVLVGHRVSVTGRVRPEAAGQAVKLQVSTGGGWRTVAVAALEGDRSRYTAAYAPPAAGTYLLRVRKPSDASHRRGTSRTLTLVATPSLPPT